jgi:hypothetical protein
LKDLDVDGTIIRIKTDGKEIVSGDVDWLDPARDREKWPAVVNTVTNIRIT